MSTIEIDLDEGRYLTLGCIACRVDAYATLGLAHPVRAFAVALVCDCCGAELVTFDQFSGEAL